MESTPPRNSEPVLVALRALRRRIARLERERQGAHEETAELRLEIEAAHDELGGLTSSCSGAGDDNDDDQELEDRRYITTCTAACIAGHRLRQREAESRTEALRLEIGRVRLEASEFEAETSRARRCLLQLKARRGAFAL
jgi:hypothetical protein